MAAEVSRNHHETLPPKHSYANFTQMKVMHTHLDLTIDFDKKILHGHATLSVKRQEHYSGTTLWLDAQGLTIKSVTGDVVSYKGMSTPKFGEPLRIETKDKDNVTITIDYETSPNAAGLVWLNGNQTRSGMPFMFAMNEPTNYRTMAPGQDTPTVRGTYSANLTIQKSPLIKEPFLALIAGGNNPTKANSEMIYRGLESKVPIPSYLFVLAAGRIEYEQLDPKVGFYADNKETINDALAGFKNATRYLEQLEHYLGTCKWARQDFLFLPAMFGFGGMENPGLIYINEGLVEKTGASAYVIAHELAHMKTGNEVTNKDWKAFWLNEGWTTYYEQRLLGDVHGPEFREGAEYEEYLELIAKEHERLAAGAQEIDGQPTRLHKFDTKNIHPDELLEFSVYPKGANFLKNIEVVIGLDKFDLFAKNYIKDFSLRPINSKLFAKYAEDKLTELHPNFNWKVFLHEWIYEPGLHPEATKIGVKEIYQPRCNGCDDKVKEFQQHQASTNFDSWNRFHIAYLINDLKKQTNTQNNQSIKTLLSCSSFTNKIDPIIDIKSLWYQTLIKAGLWQGQQAELEAFLTRIGRGRIIKPIYAELLSTKNSADFAFAKKVFTANKDRYFNQVAGSIQSMFDRHQH